MRSLFLIKIRSIELHPIKYAVNKMLQVVVVHTTKNEKVPLSK